MRIAFSFHCYQADRLSRDMMVFFFFSPFLIFFFFFFEFFFFKTLITAIFCEVFFFFSLVMVTSSGGKGKKKKKKYSGETADLFFIMFVHFARGYPLGTSAEESPKSPLFLSLFCMELGGKMWGSRQFLFVLIVFNSSLIYATSCIPLDVRGGGIYRFLCIQTVVPRFDFATSMMPLTTLTTAFGLLILWVGSC